MIKILNLGSILEFFADAMFIHHISQLVPLRSFFTKQVSRLKKLCQEFGETVAMLLMVLRLIFGFRR